MMSKLYAAPMAAIALIAGAHDIAIAQARLDRSCRREIVKTCGLTRDRDALRQCLQNKAQSLSATCRANLIEVAQQRRATGAASTGATEYRYGNDARQALDFYAAPAPNAPLVVFIHGGGWSIGDKATGVGVKPAHYTGLGYAFASLNYRLVPNTDPAGQAADVAAAIAWLRTEAARLGIDGNRIIVMGHSAGAHLAALIGSDERYLATAGVPLAALRGVVLLDGAGYDVPRQMAAAGPQLGKTYVDAFSNDPTAQKRLSPITYAAAPNARSWLLVHDANRADSGVQARDLATALARSGASTKVVPVPDSNHMMINRNLGVAGDDLTAQVDAFVQKVL